jgi:hypothetical protein
MGKNADVKLFYADYSERFIQAITEEKYQQFYSLGGSYQLSEEVMGYAHFIHVDSTGENDPILSIVAITLDRPLSKERQERIGQDCVNWLFENGYMEK